jgi:hypothetical protein
MYGVFLSYHSTIQTTSKYNMKVITIYFLSYHSTIQTIMQDLLEYQIPLFLSYYSTIQTLRIQKINPYTYAFLSYHSTIQTRSWRPFQSRLSTFYPTIVQFKHVTIAVPTNRPLTFYPITVQFKLSSIQDSIPCYYPFFFVITYSSNALKTISFGLTRSFAALILISTSNLSGMI